jgi:hypothetical protein
MLDSTQLTFDYRDEFQRKTVAEKVIQLLESDIDISPMIIDGGWGTGKTEFCHKLINLMMERDIHQPIYINAFLADHSDEPLLTILAEVLKLIPDEEQLESTMKKVLPAVRFGLKTLAKGAVAHLLRQDATDVVNDFDKEISEVTNKAIDASVEAMLKDHIKANESLTALQNTLKELAEIKPIVIFIDELDRCRPNFAISILEVIKHAFNVAGVKFVLITNTQQLKASINHCYGYSVDAHRYLDKFLKFSFILPNTFKADQRNNLEKASIMHCKNLLRTSIALSNTQLSQGCFFEFIGKIIHANSLSLREVETLVRHLEVYQILTNVDGLENNIINGYKIIRIWGVALFALRPDIAKSITDDRSDATLLGNFFGENGLPNWDGRHPYPEYNQVFLMALGRECYFNADLYKPSSDEALSRWEHYFNQLFGNHFPPSIGERLPILAETIRKMTFAL